MEKLEVATNEEASRTLVAYMSLETMFQDKRVRALADAAGRGDIAKIRLLITRGVNVNSKGTRNATPLFWSMRNINGFKELLGIGADPNVIFDDGGSVITWAIRNTDKSFLVAALKHGGNPNIVTGEFKETPLFKAASPEGKDKVDILLNAGADIDARDSFGDTPIIIAAGLGQFDMVYELLERGADYNITNFKGYGLLDAIESRKKTMDPKNELSRWMEKVIEWLNQQKTRDQPA